MSWKTVALVVVVGGGALVAFLGDDIREGLRPEGERVQVRAVLSAECPRERPLQLEVQNDHDRPLREVTLGMSIHERGDSEDIAEAASLPSWTLIVEPHQKRAACFPVRLRRPSQAGFDGLVVTVNWKHPSFYASGEQVPR